MMSFQTIKVDELDEGRIIKVTLSRLKTLNAMNPKFFQELPLVFSSINQKQNARVVILVGDGRIFTSGLDLKEYASLFSFDTTSDIARLSKVVYETILSMQKSLLSIIECKVPVIAGIHNKCIGGGIDLTSMCDIRYCTKDSEFTIKQIDIGMAADIGTLQLFPNIIGNQSTFRELAFTGRVMYSDEARQIGFVSKVFTSKTQLDSELLLTAKSIASKSPVGIYTLKQVMKREQYKKVHENLEYMARINSSMLITKDMTEAISSLLMKKSPNFSKL